jgi:hypothetical protein
MRFQRKARRFLLVLIVATAMLAMLGIPAAHAGEAARNCTSYYAQGDTSSPWHFTVCVKLIHDPNTHKWWSTASISSTTPGIRLYLDDIYIYMDVYNQYPTVKDINTTTRFGTGSDFVTAITYKITCDGGHYFAGTAGGHAIWPNGVTSSRGTAVTDPWPYWGTC